MNETTAPTTTAPAATTTGPAPEPKKQRAKPGFIDQAAEDNITLADACFHEAAKPDVAAILAQREWTAADQQKLGDSLGCCDDLKKRIIKARAGADNSSTGEDDARAALLTALDPILKGARRTLADDAERTAYGVGGNIINRSTKDLLTIATYAAGQFAPGENNAPPKTVLKGVNSAEIAAIAALAKQYENADWAHADADKDASALLALLYKEISDTLNPLRRDLQFAADMGWTHRDPVNAAQRKAFGLQPGKPLVV